MTPEVAAILECRKPTIAAVNGVAVGIGMDLAVLCDMRIASERARFGQLFVKMGLMADVTGYWCLPRSSGPRRPRGCSSPATSSTPQEALAHRSGVAGRPHRRADGRGPRTGGSHRGEPADRRASTSRKGCARAAGTDRHGLPDVRRSSANGLAHALHDGRSQGSGRRVHGEATGDVHGPVGREPRETDARPRSRAAAHDRRARRATTPDRVAMLDVEGRDGHLRRARPTTHRRWAAAFRRLGVEAGETVVTMLPNSFESYYAWLGVAWLRAIEVPTNNMYRGDMLRYLVDRLRGAASSVICERYLDRLADVARRARAARDGRRARRRPATCPSCGIRMIGATEFFGGVEPAVDEPGPEYFDICRDDLHVGHDRAVEGRARAVGRAVRVRPHAARGLHRPGRRRTTRCTRRSTCPGSRRCTSRPATHGPRRDPRAVQPHRVLERHPRASTSRPPASSARWPRC